MACLLKNEPASYFYHARLNRRDGAVVKASLNRAIKYNEVDPKPDDLSMSRLKVR